MATGPMTFFERMNAAKLSRPAASQDHSQNSWSAMKTDELMSRLSPLQAHSQSSINAMPSQPAASAQSAGRATHNRNHSTSASSSNGRKRLKSVTPRLSPAAPTPVLSPALPAEPPSSSKENIPMNDQFKAAAAKSSIRVRSPEPEKTMKKEPGSPVKRMLSTVDLPERTKRVKNEPAMPDPLKVDLTSKDNSGRLPPRAGAEKSSNEKPVVSLTTGKSVEPPTTIKLEPSALEVLKQEMGQTTPLQTQETLDGNPADALARIRSDMQAYKLETIAAFDQWGARLAALEQGLQKTTQPAESTLSASTTNGAPTISAEPKYTAKEMKAMTHHVTIKVRLGKNIRSYRVSENDTVGTILRHASFDFESIAGRLADHYLRLGDSDLNSRWILKDLDVVEGDILDVIQDSKNLNSQWQLKDCNKQLSAIRLGNPPAPSPSASAIKKKYDDALKHAAQDFKSCNDCYQPFNSEFRGAPEDPSIRHLAYNCTKCGSEQMRVNL